MNLRENLVNFVIFIFVLGIAVGITKFLVDKNWQKRIAESPIKPDTVTKIEYIRLAPIQGTLTSTKPPTAIPRVEIRPSINVDSLNDLVTILVQPQSTSVTNDTIGKLYISYFPVRQLLNQPSWDYTWNPAPVKEIVREQKIFVTVPASEMKFWDKARPYLEGAAIGVVVVSVVQLLGRTTK